MYDREGHKYSSEPIVYLSFCGNPLIEIFNLTHELWSSNSHTFETRFLTVLIFIISFIFWLATRSHFHSYVGCFSLSVSLRRFSTPTKIFFGIPWSTFHYTYCTRNKQTWNWMVNRQNVGIFSSNFIIHCFSSI